MAHSYHSECMGKTPYATKAKAIDRIHHQTKNKRRHKRRCGEHMTLVPYRCPFCHHWHVGSTSKLLPKEKVR